MGTDIYFWSDNEDSEVKLRNSSACAQEQGYLFSLQSENSSKGARHEHAHRASGYTPWRISGVLAYLYLVMIEFLRPSAENPVNEFLRGQPGFRQCILVVEDEGDLRQLNAEMLVEAGYQVEVAEDGASAWVALQLHRYALLITDQFLPKLSGVELLKKIHTAQMTLPVIMATGILPTWEFALHPCLQAVTMLRKPYTMDKLLGLVKSVLPEPGQVHVEIVSASSWQVLPSTDCLRLL